MWKWFFKNFCQFWLYWPILWLIWGFYLVSHLHDGHKLLPWPFELFPVQIYSFSQLISRFLIFTGIRQKRNFYLKPKPNSIFNIIFAKIILKKHWTWICENFNTVGSPFFSELSSVPYRIVPYRNRPSIVLKNTAPSKRN